MRDGDELTSGWRQVKGSAAAPRCSPWPWIVLLALGLAWLLWVLRTEPTAVTDSMPTPAPASLPTVSAATYPAEMLRMAEAITTALAPTPEPTPTYAAPPTPDPVLVCGPWVTVGEVCTMPRAPRPTPTPLPDCPAAEQDQCVWQGTPLPVLRDDRRS